MSKKQWLAPALTLGFLILLLAASVAAIPLLRAHGKTAQAGQDEAVEKPAAPAPCVAASTLAGKWYPKEPEALKEQIDGFLAKTPDETYPDVIALILPHAGYAYSGQTAAYGVKQIAGKSYARVVVMGPSHHAALTNQAGVPDATAYETPLGEIPLDVEFIVALKQHPEFISEPAACRGEHSVQIELPLLQRTLGAFKLVPVIVGELNAKTSQAMAETLAGLIDERTLVIASSDFTHYGANYGYTPFTENIPENITALDMGAFAFIEKKDPAGFQSYVEEKEATICGRNPIGVLLEMLPADASVHLLHYSKSGELTNDYTLSVSYVSAAATGKWSKKGGDSVEPHDTPALTEDEKRSLLELARKTIDWAFTHHGQPTAEELGVTVASGMRQVMGAFVTLHERGQLRGCIGEIEPRRPLFEAVIGNAINAAFSDPRFSPLTTEELPKVDIEISALTPPRPVGSYQDIIIGKHGMVLSKDGRRAVFLPQVAPEQGWTLEQTLSHLSMKAGLSSDAWKEGASYTVFEAIVFGEHGA